MRQPRNRLKTYLVVALLVISASLAGGWIFSTPISNLDPLQSATLSESALVDDYFKQGVSQMVKKQYSQAAETWQKLLVLNNTMPEAHANLGFSLYETGQYQGAAEHFKAALDLNAYQVNAYYGLAICLEQLSDLEGALGAMRSFIHMAKQDDPFLRKARAAVWEWESRLQQESKPESRDSQAPQQPTQAG